ncbi:alpha-amylase family glycosyl hydrolase [Natroniella acetigena]|uniref:alpha-amylase family glycosyl hydrolase n=1 Tax=Natroniella acetigena TaxID=52004 RepID=UPI00200A03F5|nr:alpha-amylase family glycosyl hydrolase [Natroniella acetigena]MCK8827387.1 alpha-amylase family glycosyl hydrolase [Natroniella acetigena]
MRTKVRIHYDNKNNFRNPVLWAWLDGTGRFEKKVYPDGRDDYGLYYDLVVNRANFNFKFKDELGDHTIWEDERNNRFYNAGLGGEIWCKAGWHNVYNVRPAEPVGHIKEAYQEIKDLIPQDNFYLPDTDVSKFETPSLLGAHKLTDGSLSFALYHPRAGRVYLGSNLNNFQTPGNCLACDNQEDSFIELDLYKGYYNQPNIWWTRVPAAQIDPKLSEIEYKFFVRGGIGGNERWAWDPYTRVYSDNYQRENCVVADPTNFEWTDQDWETPDISELIIYELNVYGFTDEDSDLSIEEQSTFKGVIRRIEEGYFDDLGVTALALMPTSESWSHFGLGYDPCSFMSIEKDFGDLDDFRKLVDIAHNHGLAVIVDQVFNHTSNQFNPLWDLIDDGSGPGGLYFSGSTKWGNRVATGRPEVDNMLIDSCKLFIEEYHVDGFRFDATHSNYLDHQLLYEIQDEIRDSGFKPNTILIAENLPNESDLNFEGYNGYAQWSDMFHDKIKALLREGVYRDWCYNTPQGLGDIFYFSKNQFAEHTNNVVNYSESHDEPSVKFEIETNEITDCNVKDRKAKLAMMATMTALGQPMLYMGQEFGINRDANNIDLNKVSPDPNCPEFEYNPFLDWTQRLINLRKKYGALKVSGANPIETGEFSWVLGPWLSEEEGKNRRLIGWKTKDKDNNDEMLILLNFEGADIKVNLGLTLEGKWGKIAALDQINDFKTKDEIEPMDILSVGQNKKVDFNLPAYSGFIYKKI